MIVDSLHKSMWFLGIIYTLGAVCFYFNSSKSNKKKPTPQKTSITSIFSKLPNILFNKKLFPIYCCSLFVLLSFVSLLFIIHFIFVFGLAYAIPSMITCITIESETESRGIAVSLYTCVLFIGASIGAFLPTIFEMNNLILLITLFLFICALQLILNKRNYY